VCGNPGKSWRDESGASFVEFTAVILAFLVIVLGFVDFSYAFYQWNSATKAVQYGARLAAVSNPVASDLTTLSGVSSTVLPGDPMPAFTRVCTATNASGSSGTCSGGSGNDYNAPAMQTLLFGRGKTACAPDEQNYLLLGMCNFYTKIIDARFVVVRYDYTGLGYAGRPGSGGNAAGPVPTITVTLTDMSFDFVFLGDLLGFSDIALPGFATTATGEDLSLAGT
jgi:Flp pilus assembly pilin Flp